MADAQPRVRASGYASWFYELAYRLASPLYDGIAWWGFLPLGGETACREQFVRWLALRPGFRIASLCCGTGSNERAILAAAPDLEVTGIDLGPGQIARARRKDRSGRIDFRVGNAAETGLPDAHYHRVLIALALHEMPPELRGAVLREARRRWRADGRVVAIEHGRPRGRISRLARALWWFFWIPGNPEVPTSRDLQRRGLENEMREAGLRPLEHHTTSPDWVEGVTARPDRTASAETP